jgi:hypothetical protein
MSSKKTNTSLKSRPFSVKKVRPRRIKRTGLFNKIGKNDGLSGDVTDPKKEISDVRNLDKWDQERSFKSKG